MATFFLTALRVSPQKAEDRAVPKVISVDSAQITQRIAIEETQAAISTAQHSIVKVSKDRYVRSIRAAESLGEVYLMEDFGNSASSPYNTGTKANVAAAGTAQGTATALTAYHNSVTSACAAPSLFGVRLPNASTVNGIGRAIVVKNAASTSIIVYPAASEILDSASTTSVTIKSGQFKHFYSPASNKFVTCKGPYYP